MAELEAYTRSTSRARGKNLFYADTTNRHAAASASPSPLRNPPDQALPYVGGRLGSWLHAACKPHDQKIYTIFVLNLF